MSAGDKCVNCPECLLFLFKAYFFPFIVHSLTDLHSHMLSFTPCVFVGFWDDVDGGGREDSQG